MTPTVEWYAYPVQCLQDAVSSKRVTPDPLHAHLKKTSKPTKMVGTPARLRYEPEKAD